VILFSDHGCPFTHRVLALLDHLGHQPERRESMVGEKPDGVHQYSSSGCVPLLVHGDLVLTESRVMLEHLAEHYELAGAYPADLGARSRHRQAIAVVDDFLAPLLFARADTEVDGPRLDDVLGFVEHATATVAPHACLLAFHVAPIWLRFRWWHPAGSVTRAVEARGKLCGWLDAVVELDSLKRTASDPATPAQALSRARKAAPLSPETRRTP
jgi:glutathione S-transferase